MDKPGDGAQASEGQADRIQGRLSVEPELDESVLRYERPSPHFTIEQLQTEAELQPVHDRLARAATADNLGDVAQVTREGLSPTTGRDESIDRWVQLQHGPDPYTDAVARHGSAYEGPSELRGSTMSGTGDGRTPGVSPQFDEAAKHERSADQLRAVQGDHLSTANRDKLGAAIRGEHDRAQVARATAVQQAERARTIQEGGPVVNKQNTDSGSVAKNVESARHPMDQKSEAARAAFNEAAAGHQPPQAQTTQGVESEMVKNQRPQPQLNMKGDIGAAVDRQVHQQQMAADNNAAKSQNERTKAIFDAAKRNAQGAGHGQKNGHGH